MYLRRSKFFIPLFGGLGEVLSECEKVSPFNSPSKRGIYLLSNYKIVFLTGRNRFFFNNAVFRGKTTYDEIYIYFHEKRTKIPR
jgi:hypothetical protein